MELTCFRAPTGAETDAPPGLSLPMPQASCCPLTFSPLGPMGPRTPGSPDSPGCPVVPGVPGSPGLPASPCRKEVGASGSCRHLSHPPGLGAGGRCRAEGKEALGHAPPAGALSPSAPSVQVLRPCPEERALLAPTCPGQLKVLGTEPNTTECRGTRGKALSRLVMQYCEVERATGEIPAGWSVALDLPVPQVQVIKQQRLALAL